MTEFGSEYQETSASTDGELFRQARRILGVDQQGLAGRLRIDPSYMSKVEGDNQAPSPRLLRGLYSELPDQEELRAAVARRIEERTISVAEVRSRAQQRRYSDQVADLHETPSPETTPTLTTLFERVRDDLRDPTQLAALEKLSGEWPIIKEECGLEADIELQPEVLQGLFPSERKETSVERQSPPRELSAEEVASLPFGERVRYERRHRGWTIEYVSKRTGISTTVLSRTETGARPPSENTEGSLNSLFRQPKEQ